MNETIAQVIRKLNHKFFVVETFYDGEKENVNIKSFDKLGKMMEFTLDLVVMNNQPNFDNWTDWKVEVFQRHLDGTCHRVCYKS